MPSRPLLVFCLRDVKCPLVEAMRLTVIEAGGGDGCFSAGLDFSRDVPPLAARLLQATPYPEQGYTELWVRVSGERRLLAEFMANLRRVKGVYHQVVHENKFNKAVRVVISHDSSSACSLADRARCPLNSSLPGALVKSLLLLPEGVLYELIVARSNVLDLLRDVWGCRIIDVRGLEEMDYMLTEKQELALIYAYLSGYYKFPRRVSLKTLARRLGLSVSTLAEFLRRAEGKVVESYVRHELPHYMAALAMHGSQCIEKIEAALRGKNGVETRRVEDEEEVAATAI